jgi:hypothetical protein
MTVVDDCFEQGLTPAFLYTSQNVELAANILVKCCVLCNALDSQVVPSDAESFILVRLLLDHLHLGHQLSIFSLTGGILALEVVWIGFGSFAGAKKPFAQLQETRYRRATQ